MAAVELTPVTPPQDLHDRDFDPPRGGEPVRCYSVGQPLTQYQRLVANPFLAVGTIVGGLGLAVNAVRWKQLEMFWAACVLLLSSPLWLQYHCLDCGHTGHVVKARRHACSMVETRLLSGQSRSLRGPTPISQTKLWAAVLLPIVLILLEAALNH